MRSKLLIGVGLYAHFNEQPYVNDRKSVISY
jgi:hypothetical protein